MVFLANSRAAAVTGWLWLWLAVLCGCQAQAASCPGKAIRRTAQYGQFGLPV